MIQAKPKPTTLDNFPSLKMEKENFRQPWDRKSTGKVEEILGSRAAVKIGEEKRGLRMVGSKGGNERTPQAQAGKMQDASPCPGFLAGFSTILWGHREFCMAHPRPEGSDSSSGRVELGVKGARQSSASRLVNPWALRFPHTPGIRHRPTARELQSKLRDLFHATPRALRSTDPSKMQPKALKRNGVNIGPSTPYKLESTSQLPATAPRKAVALSRHSLGKPVRLLPALAPMDEPSSGTPESSIPETTKEAVLFIDPRLLENPTVGQQGSSTQHSGQSQCRSPASEINPPPEVGEYDNQTQDRGGEPPAFLHPAIDNKNGDLTQLGELPTMSPNNTQAWASESVSRASDAAESGQQQTQYKIESFSLRTKKTIAFTGEPVRDVEHSFACPTLLDDLGMEAHEVPPDVKKHIICTLGRVYSQRYVGIYFSMPEFGISHGGPIYVLQHPRPAGSPRLYLGKAFMNEYFSPTRRQRLDGGKTTEASSSASAQGGPSQETSKNGGKRRRDSPDEDGDDTGRPRKLSRTT
ncbi:hypothetical protein QBC47DRAFT_445969 [Echria macrotheca]|uniref:Uncharacterized protein n=1 Tax=Echria macrotheca TaxID=438768 RepID=A0AAJ0BCE3_9PEZI|nr:hypothetical protein QBC47DRAFT_445969 [Echria macrotheca]